MTFTLGWWALPTIITVALFVWSGWYTDKSRDYAPDLTGLFRGVVAIIVSLVAWLIWALVA